MVLYIATAYSNALHEAEIKNRRGKGCLIVEGEHISCVISTRGVARLTCHSTTQGEHTDESGV